MALYHYTTEMRLQDILGSGKWHPSTDTVHDSTYGEGWYLTDLPPTTCEKVLMQYCWEKSTLHRRVEYYMMVAVVGALAQWVRDHVFLVPRRQGVSFTILHQGKAPECSLKPCNTCSLNPDNR
jgi:hypothetical protein